MRPPAIGAQARLRVVVTDEMTARFDDEVVHPVYGTAALVRHAEQCARRLLVPALEDGEEGVGAEVAVRHLAPVPVGAEVEHVATVVAAAARRLVTDFQVRHGDRVVARGRFTQGVVNLEAWRASIALPE